MTSPDTAPLLAAIEPIAAYCARTPAPNTHADRCAALVNAAADYVEAVEQVETVRTEAPDWRAIALRMAACLDTSAYPPSPLAARVGALLATPALRRRAALPLAQRMYLAQINSHYLGTPSTL